MERALTTKHESSWVFLSSDSRSKIQYRLEGRNLEDMEIFLENFGNCVERPPLPCTENIQSHPVLAKRENDGLERAHLPDTFAALLFSYILHHIHI